MIAFHYEQNVCLDGGVIEAWSRTQMTYLRVVAKEREQLRSLFLASQREEERMIANCDSDATNASVVATPQMTDADPYDHAGDGGSRPILGSEDSHVATTADSASVQQQHLSHSPPVALDGAGNLGEVEDGPRDLQDEGRDVTHSSSREEDEKLQSLAAAGPSFTSDADGKGGLEGETSLQTSEVSDDGYGEGEEQRAHRLKEEAELERRQAEEAEAEQRRIADERERVDVKALVSERLCVLLVDPGVAHVETSAMNRAVREFLCHHLLPGSSGQDGLMSTTIQRRIVR